MACEAHMWCADRCHPQGTIGCPLELLLLPFALREPLRKHNCFCEQKELVLEIVSKWGHLIYCGGHSPFNFCSHLFFVFLKSFLYLLSSFLLFVISSSSAASIGGNVSPGGKFSWYHLVAPATSWLF
jgi:hypothetical protein